MLNESVSNLHSSANVLAEEIVDRLYALNTHPGGFLSQASHEKSVRDTGYHLSYLFQALEANDPVLFVEYLAWVKALFANLGFSPDVLTNTLDSMRFVLSTRLSGETQVYVLRIFDLAVQNLAAAPVTPPSYLRGSSPTAEMARQYLAFLLAGNRKAASQMILQAVQGGVPLREIYLGIFQPSQREIGRLWQTNQITVAQEHFCTAATQMVMAQLYPYLFTGERKDHRMVTACVGGELHEIGARMVADFFELEGWDTYFLGANTPLESIIGAVSERKADILALSVTMTFHLNRAKEIIAALRSESALANVRILVGGYPFNLSPQLWKNIGADGYAADAEAAVCVAGGVLVT